MKYGPEYDPEAEGGFEPIRKRRLRNNQTERRRPLYRLTEVNISLEVAKTLNKLFEAATKEAERLRENDPSLGYGNVSWRLKVWPRVPDRIRSLSILIPFRHDQSVSIIMSCPLDEWPDLDQQGNSETGSTEECKAVILFPFNSRRGVGLGFAGEGQLPDQKTAAELVRELVSLINDGGEVELGLQVQKPGGGKIVWTPVRESYEICPSLKAWISGVNAVRSAGEDGLNFS